MGTNKQTRDDLKEILVESTTNNLRGINIPEDPIYETKGESTEELEQSFKYVIENSKNDLEEKGQVESVESVEPTLNQEIRYKDESDKTAHFKGGDGKTETTYEPREKTKVLATKGLEKSGNELDKIEVDEKLEDSEEKEKVRHKKESEKHKAGKPTTNMQTRDNLKQVTVEATTKNIIGINIPADPINETIGEISEDIVEQFFKDGIKKSNSDLEEKLDKAYLSTNEEVSQNDGYGKPSTFQQIRDKLVKGTEETSNSKNESEKTDILDKTKGNGTNDLEMLIGKVQEKIRTILDVGEKERKHIQPYSEISKKNNEISERVKTVQPTLNIPEEDGGENSNNVIDDANMHQGAIDTTKLEGTNDSKDVSQDSQSSQTTAKKESRKRIEVENVEATDSKNAIEKVIIHEKEIDTRKRQGSKGRKQPSKNEASEKHQSDQASINKAGRDKLVDEKEETADSKSDLGKTNMTEDVIEKTKEQKRDVIEKIHKEVSELMQKKIPCQ